MSLQKIDERAGEVAVDERVTLASLEELISNVYYNTAEVIATGEDAIREKDQPTTVTEGAALKLLTICVIVTKSGYTTIGHSAPAAPKNFNAELGRQAARDKALAQLWPLEGYMLRAKLYQRDNQVEQES